LAAIATSRKWVKVLRWVEPSEAIDLIRAGIERANS
jgi:inorganic pyrophosphatase